LKFTSIKRKRLYEDVLAQLQEYLIKDKIEPGHKLPSERELAQMFNVNRVSVREALAIMEANGVVERKIGGGTFSASTVNFAATSLVQVLARNQNLIREAMQVRRVIEPQLARLAALHQTEELMQCLKHNLQRQQERLSNRQDIIDLDSEFHFYIARATNNTIIIGLVEALHDSLKGTRIKSLQAREGGNKSYQGHKAIYSALEARDADKAEEVMFDHLKQVERLILSYLTEQESIP